VRAATLEGYRGHVRHILAQLDGRQPLAALDGDALDRWVAGEVRRLGRTHTVVKRLESIIKPAVRYAYDRGQLARLPIWPELRSDYRSEGKHRTFYTREQAAALWGELPEVRIIERTDGGKVVVFPRKWLTLALCTGMHAADLDRFRGCDYNAAARLWLRRNTKGDRHYEPEWLPALDEMVEALDNARRTRVVDGNRLWVAELEWNGDDRISPLRPQWMRDQLDSAARRCGVAVAPTPNHLRRTFATWRYSDGWTFEETARWLANSSGMVREVYAQLPAAAMVRAVQRTRRSSRKLIALTQSIQGPRKGPRQSAAVPGSESGSKLSATKGLTHGKLSKRGGYPTD
jgi:hypothetical protein